MEDEPFDALDRGILGLIAVYDEVARDVPSAADLASIPRCGHGTKKGGERRYGARLINAHSFNAEGCWRG